MYICGLTAKNCDIIKLAKELAYYRQFNQMQTAHAICFWFK